MKIRQMILVASVALVVSSQVSASTTLSVRKGEFSEFTGHNSVFSASVRRMKADDAGDPTKPGPLQPFLDAMRLDGSTLPINAYGSLNNDPTILTSLSSEWPQGLISGVSDTTNPLLRQAFFIGVDMKNAAVPSGAIGQIFGLNEGRQWNIGELNLTANPIPAPVAILIGSIGVGIIGWMRISRTYTI